MKLAVHEASARMSSFNFYAYVNRTERKQKQSSDRCVFSLLQDLGQSTNLSLEDKAQLFSAKLSESMHRSRMQYRIQGSRMLTGGKSLFVNLPDKLQEVCQSKERRLSLSPSCSAVCMSFFARLIHSFSHSFNFSDYPHRSMIPWKHADPPTLTRHHRQAFQNKSLLSRRINISRQ